jgi:hypothetical protein
MGKERRYERKVEFQKTFSTSSLAVLEAELTQKNKR